ncbi:ABC transporter ATP-binding protein [Caproiciproducens sp. CPB-2]|uniref:ABC transporter ATP-binding protein n=1 Tax=Caproiciproducens sp. CPB-2 TaxID=3030017 RepID=UPI0023DA5B51|nr:ATP-binding cassette domain-containing protein [Caproiciproducens sp. CPB-2]MDF1493866.1 ATP-binding cassette domain-containing protein [Caproiciproducens sp. CPB-2]
MESKMLVIDRVTVSYKTKKGRTPVIEGLSLQIEEGEVLAVLGPSGCGKSTLINALAGMLPLDGGSVSSVTGGEKRPLNPRTHKIGVIPQNCGLLPWKTVGENCLLPLKLRRETVTEERRREISGICDALDVSRLLHRYPAQLSGGQVQRAALARAFIFNPDLLLMDEPFSALDAITRQDARELFLRIWKRNRPTTILVTHSIEEALYLGNTVAVMGNRRGVLRYSMKNPYFGQSDPESVDYLTAKRILHEKLGPEGERRGNIEQTAE